MTARIGVRAMVNVRKAQHRDCEQVARLSAEAAREAGAVGTSLDVDHVRQHGFGGQALFEAFIAEDSRGRPPIGLAIITKGYDVRRAVATVVLCELFIRPEHRRTGAARVLMSGVARRAQELGARELQITTGVENEVARKFFAAIGAHENQAVTFMMTADGIDWLAAEGR
ncbi:MAG: GNAT family N-acetyltransferase [Hydrogenophilaceae bacterium]|nr:GNAT family N-acetyltransferase [Hydrogenophilaceae bacterium]